MEPPRRFRKALVRVLPRGVVGESIVGDLDQELEERLAAGASPFWTRWWYRWEAVKLAARWTLEGLSDDKKNNGGWTMGWLQDVKYGVRMLFKSPLTTVVAALSIAAGIAASATMFSIYWAFLYAPLPYQNQNELLLVRQPNQDSPYDSPMAPGVFLELADGTRSVESWAAWRNSVGNLTGGEEPEQVTVVSIYPESFSALGRQPALGRSFTAEDGRPGAAPTAILHHDLWASRFASDPGVVGSTVTLDGTATTVVGVMPPDFDLLSFDGGGSTIFVPDDFQEERAVWADRSLLVSGRLRPGAGLDAASSEIRSAFQRIQGEQGGELEEQVARVSLLRDEIPGESDTRLVQVLLAVGLFVLFLAAANVANLLLAKAEVRQGEVAIRMALGAGRARVLRQLLTESVILAAVGAGLGAALAYFGVQAMDASMPPQIPDVMRPHMNGPVLLFTGALAVATGLFFGLAPALQALRADMAAGLGEGRSRGGTADRQRKRLRSAFVAGQVAVALALLVGASSLVSVANSIAKTDGGFDQDGVLTFSTAFPEYRYPEDAELARVTRQLRERLETVSGVEGVAVMRALPRSSAFTLVEFSRPGDAADPDAGRRTSAWETVSPSWFETLGVELQSGRLFNESDGPDAPPVAIVNAAFARKHFPDGNPIGQRLTLDSWDREATVVGVVEDVLHWRVSLAEEFGTMIYVPIAQQPRRSPAIAVRAAGIPGALAPAVRQAVWSVDPELPVAQVQSLNEFVDAQMAATRFLSLALIVFGVVALILSAMGIWGVIAHAVAQRTRELGIRMALGAEGRSLVGLVSRQGLALTALGLVLGTPLAILVLNFAGGVVAEFDVEMPSPVLYLAIGGVLLAVAMLASWVPSIRAARVDPRKALAAE